jgi:hypothetical protein
LRASYVAWNRRREAKAGEYIYVYNYIHNMYIIYITHIDIYIHTYIHIYIICNYIHIHDMYILYVY